MDRNQIEVIRGLVIGVALLGLASCAHRAGERFPAGQISRDPAATFELPNRGALGAWRPDARMITGEKDLGMFARIEIDCQDKNLYPTHPQQETKTVHRFSRAIYDANRLVAADVACTLGSKSKTARGQKACLRANFAEDVILSDVFADSCGHTYRGFWQTVFLKTDETPASLASKGRTLYPDPNAETENATVAGHTFAVPAEDFIFLSPPFAGDEEKASTLAKSALGTHSYDEKTRLFQSK